MTCHLIAMFIFLSSWTVEQRIDAMRAYIITEPELFHTKLVVTPQMAQFWECEGVTS